MIRYLVLNVVGFFMCVQIYSIQNSQTLFGYIFSVMCNISPPNNFANFRMLFLAVMKDFVDNV